MVHGREGERCGEGGRFVCKSLIKRGLRQWDEVFDPVGPRSLTLWATVGGHSNRMSPSVPKTRLLLSLRVAQKLPFNPRQLIGGDCFFALDVATDLTSFQIDEIVPDQTSRSLRTVTPQLKSCSRLVNPEEFDSGTLRPILRSQVIWRVFDKVTCITLLQPTCRTRILYYNKETKGNENSRHGTFSIMARGNDADAVSNVP